MINTKFGVTIAKCISRPQVFRLPPSSLTCCGPFPVSVQPAAQTMSLHFQSGLTSSQFFVTRTASPVQKCNPMDSLKTSYTLLGAVRSFGRHASKMGHHLQNLDEMAHKSSHDEAQIRREEKKKKSKKSRIISHKEGDASINEAHGDNEDDLDESTKITDEDESGISVLPEINAVRSKMLVVVTSMERSFSSIRGGEATPELFDSVRVSAYGETVPLSSVGQVVIEDPQRATISCYDLSLATDVRDAVRDIPGMNLNPYVEEGGSGVVIVPIPRVSAESRIEIVKELGRQAENGRQRIRKIRRDAMDAVKKGKDGKLEGVSKDDAFRVGKDIETVTEEVLAALNGLVEKKQKSVMED